MIDIHFRRIDNFCLRETFPFLRNKKITRVEWNLIRKLLGKPRRCSPAFFQEERDTLEAKRQKVRILQRGGSIPSDQLHDLPQSIPALLPVGTRVTCRVGKRASTAPQFGGRQISENLLVEENFLGCSITLPVKFLDLWQEALERCKDV